MFFFFFFKQKTAYEMLRSLVGSEMCIRDSGKSAGIDEITGEMIKNGGEKVIDWIWNLCNKAFMEGIVPVSYTHLRAHETPEHLVCRLLLEKKKIYSSYR